MDEESKKQRLDFLEELELELWAVMEEKLSKFTPDAKGEDNAKR